MTFLERINALSFGSHLLINVVLRLTLIGYGEFQDSLSEVKYTDVDYRVITDGARHMLNNESPFERHTYRYTPLLAILAIPNILVHKCVGKLLFAIFDLLVGIIIQRILCDEFMFTFRSNAEAIKNRVTSRTKGLGSANLNIASLRLPDLYKRKAMNGALVWLYNPLPMVIATRGNGDSITSLLVLTSMFCMLKPKEHKWQYFIAGLIHGLAIHFRLYPIVFSLSYYIYAGHTVDHKNFVQQLLMPNRKQLELIAGTIIGLTGLTIIFYHLYGYEFIYESYLYHLVRKDTRHNFSLYFYLQYLNTDAEITLLEKLLTSAPQLLILVSISLAFSHNRKLLPFAILLEAFTMVTFNSVVTSQYFVWFLSILPLCLKNLSRIRWQAAVSYAALWLLTQGAWLLSAYMLEFKGWNTFHMIWLSGCVFFGVNIFLMQKIISSFNVIGDFKRKEL